MRLDARIWVQQTRLHTPGIQGSPLLFSCPVALNNMCVLLKLKSIARVQTARLTLDSYIQCRACHLYLDSTWHGQGELFTFFFLTSLLEYNCFTMVCWFLLYNKVNQLYTYIYPHISSRLRELFSFASNLILCSASPAPEMIPPSLCVSQTENFRILFNPSPSLTLHIQSINNFISFYLQNWHQNCPTLSLLHTSNPNNYI